MSQAEDSPDCGVHSSHRLDTGLLIGTQESRADCDSLSLSLSLSLPLPLPLLSPSAARLQATPHPSQAPLLHVSELFQIYMYPKVESRKT